MNTVRAVFAGWHDRLIMAIMLIVGLAMIRSWFADLPLATATWVAFGAAVVLGGGAERLVVARLAFHRFDGLLAADALRPLPRRQYTVLWHGIGLAALTMITLIARPSLLTASLSGYLVGALMAGLMAGFAMPKSLLRMTWSGRVIREWLDRPVAGAAAAVILPLSLLPARELGTNALIAVAGVETLLLALALTIVDDGIVRYMTIAGHGSRRIVAHRGKSLALFLAITVPGCWLVFGPGVAAIVAAASSALLLLLILRVLAYRLHGKRFADSLVAILVGLLMLVTYAVPIALPFVAVAILWHLQRRATATTWLLT